MVAFHLASFDWLIGHAQWPEKNEAAEKSRGADGRGNDGWRDQGRCRTGSERENDEGDRLAGGEIQDGIRDARCGRLHARGDQRDAQHSDRNVEVPSVSGEEQTARHAGGFCTGVGVMTEDNFEQFLKKTARSYNAPPAHVPREAMWNAIQAKRAA